jgi:hypothetical protein
MGRPILQTKPYQATAHSVLPHAQADHTGHTQSHIAHRESFFGRVGQLISELFWSLAAKHPRLHGFSMELRSLPWRMEFQSKLHKGSLIVDLGLALEKTPDGRGIPNRRTHARIAGIESFVSKCPGATLFERWVFLQGWDAAEEFVQRNSDKANKAAESPRVCT